MSAGQDPHRRDKAVVLLPGALRGRLLANGQAEDGTDPIPVVKFFNPVGPATWIITELMADGDTLFGICDLGFGCPELGTVSLGELQSISLPFGLGIERDLWFRPRFTIAAFAEAARLLGRITEDEVFLAQAARRLGLPDLPPDFAAVTERISRSRFRP
jgi:hypothetical protein